MKKRACALTMALTMAISAFTAVPVFAEDFTWEAVVSDTNVNVGETFDLDFKVTANPGINNATVFLKYNANVVRPVATTSAPEDLMSYTTTDGTTAMLFSTYKIDSFISSQDVSKGQLRIANYIAEPDEEMNLLEETGTGTLFRVSFQAVGEGEANIDFVDSRYLQIMRTPKKGGNLAYIIDIPDVTVGGGSSAKTTTKAATATTTVATTEATTETTTKSLSSSVSTTHKTTTTTTTATTATTTEASTETTTAADTDNPSTSVPVALSFTDLADYPWAVDYINRLAGTKVVNGYSDGTFKPGDNVKRADFIIMLLRAMGIDTTAAPDSNFKDIEPGVYYYNAVGIAKDMGIASGNSDGTFVPDGYITRQDMMILAKKALETKLGTTIDGSETALDKFADKDEISFYAVDSLAAMVEKGIVNGTGNNIEPKANTTRAQAAVIICKILDQMN